MESNSHSSWSASSALDENATSCDVNASLTFSTPSNRGPTLTTQQETVAHSSSQVSTGHDHSTLQDVRHTSLQATWTPYHTFPSRPSLASSRLASYPGALPHAGSMSTHRPFHGKSQLFTRQGILFAPPAPPTTPIASPVHSMSKPSDTSDLSPDSMFSHLRSNYLNMLSQNPEVIDEPLSMPATPAPMSAISTPPHAVEASPQTRQYLTSPYDDSPCDDFLETPIVGTAEVSPVVADYGPTFGDLPLFSHVPVECKPSSNPPVVSYPNFDELYSMPSDSPRMPSLDRPTSLYEEPRVPSTAQHQTISKRRITPDSLIPIDAPTQPRTYKIPSATSRKEIPALFARKRSRSQAFGEEDQLADESGASASGEPTVTPSEAELIEAKRRQNTIAARKSRKRKLEYVMGLEESVKKLTKERDAWRSRALTSETVLKHHGLAIPQYPDL